MIIALTKYISYKMTLGSKKDYRAKQHHNVYSKRGLNGLHRR
jgi:hypothetical protein